MKIIIFYEHLTREWNAIQGLKEIFEKKNCKVWTLSIIFERSKAKLIANINKIDIIIVPWFVDKVHEEILYPIISTNPKIQVINLHHEQIGSKESQHFLIPQSDYARNGVYHFAWGEYFKDLLIANGIDPNKVFVTGNIRNDESIERTTKTSKEELARIYQLDITKKWILFAENRGWILQHNNEDTFKELIKRGGSREYLDNSVLYNKRSLDGFKSEISTMPHEFFDKYEFIYRPHPGTRLFDTLGKSVKIIADRSIYDWINVCDIFLTCESTSIFEADMCGKPCFTVDWTDKYPDAIMNGVCDYPALNSISELLQMTDEEITKKCSLHMYERYCGKVDGKSKNRVVAATYNIFKNGTAHIYPIAKLSIKGQIRQLIYEAITWLFVKTTLIYKVHFPKSAYGESRDIPYAKENRWIKEHTK